VIEEEGPVSPLIESEFDFDPTGATMGGLAGVVLRQFRTNREHREREIDDILIECHAMRSMRYTPQMEAMIRAEGAEPIYAPLGAMQSISAGASVAQVVLTPERPWTIKPTPLPDLPDDDKNQIQLQVQAEKSLNPAMTSVDMATKKANYYEARAKKLKVDADRAVNRMQRKIEDQLVHSGFYDALDDFIDDFTTYPYAVLKRVTTMQPTIKWDNGEVVRDVVAKELDLRVSPFDIYPSPGMVDVNDGPLIERMRIRPYQLAQYRTKGFIVDKVDEALSQYGHGNGSWLSNVNDLERNDIEDNSKLDSEAKGDLIDVLVYWGQLDGETLKDYGVGGVKDAEWYDTEVWLIGSHIIRVAKNPHPLDHRPYYKSVWREVPGQFWGSSPVSQVRHLEAVCNASMRALEKNMGLASGPMIAIYIDQLPQGTAEIQTIAPQQIFQLVSKPGQNGDPIKFFQPPSNANELIGVFSHFWELAGDVTGIYRWNYGADQGMQGSAQTMGGLSMLLENSNKVIRRAVSNLERGVMIRRVHDQFILNMLYERDNSIKGDIEVVAKGSSSLIERASIRQRRVELVNAMSSIPETQQPGMDALFGRIRMAILHDTAKDLDIQSEMWPTEEEIAAAMEAGANQPEPPPDPRVQAAQIAADARIEDQKLEMEDNLAKREHQLQIKQMDLQAVSMQNDKAAARADDRTKVEMAEKLASLTEKRAQFNQEKQLKNQHGTGI
jgi:hypothetical protein